MSQKTATNGRPPVIQRQERPLDWTPFEKPRVSAARYQAWRAVKRAAQPLVTSWRAIRRVIMERDGHVCRICGCDPCEERMEVHHVDWDRSNNKARNLVTLCAPCHRAIHMQGYRPGEDDHPEPWGERTDPADGPDLAESA